MQKTYLHKCGRFWIAIPSNLIFDAVVVEIGHTIVYCSDFAEQPHMQGIGTAVVSEDGVGSVGIASLVGQCMEDGECLYPVTTDVERYMRVLLFAKNESHITILG